MFGLLHLDEGSETIGLVLVRLGRGQGSCVRLGKPLEFSLGLVVARDGVDELRLEIL